MAVHEEMAVVKEQEKENKFQAILDAQDNAERNRLEIENARRMRQLSEEIHRTNVRTRIGNSASPIKKDR